jgi:hypothetical protein
LFDQGGIRDLTVPLIFLLENLHAMLHEQRCPDCHVRLEDGFIVDSSQNISLVSKWSPGSPQFRKILGWLTLGLKVRNADLIGVTTLRCPQCGLLKSYAIKP